MVTRKETALFSLTCSTNSLSTSQIKFTRLLLSLRIRLQQKDLIRDITTSIKVAAFPTLGLAQSACEKKAFFTPKRPVHAQCQSNTTLSTQILRHKDCTSNLRRKELENLLFPRTLGPTPH